MPIIVLSARGMEADKIAGFDARADDYMIKPFGGPELLARIRVALRHAARAAPRSEAVLVFGELRIDLARREVHRNEEAVHLTPHEYGLFAMLARHAGQVVTYRHLLREVWGPAFMQQTHYLRVYMGHLRQKLEADPARPRWFVFPRWVADAPLTLEPIPKSQAFLMVATNAFNYAVLDEQFGEVTNAKTLAKTIVTQRQLAPIRTINEFKMAVMPVVKGNPQKYFAQVFQALRIEVNDEFGALREMLQQSVDVLQSGGRIAVITFHSLEDRIVKNFFRNGTFDETPPDDVLDAVPKAR